MLTIIQGNDTTVSVLLHSQSLTLPDNEGESYVERSKIDLSQATDISVRLIPYMRWRPITPSFEVKGSTISIHYPASIQLVGKWDVEITFLTPEGGGYRQNRVCQAFAEVLSNSKGANSPAAYIITADVAQAVQGAKGDSGKSAYEMAQEEEGFVGTKQEYLKSLHGEPGKDIYQLAVEDGYQGSRRDYLASQKGETGKSAYEMAQEEEGFVGTKQEYLKSLRGEPGKDIYLLAVEDGYQGSRKDYLASQKGETGDSAYQSYLKTTGDKIKLTEKQWSNSNDFFFQFLFRVLKGAGVQPTETDMTADQVYELDRQRREIIEALKSKGVAVDDTDGLDGVSRAIKSITLPKIGIFKVWQFYEWQSEMLPPLRLNESYSAADLTKSFASSRIVKLPEIDNIERAKSIRAMCQNCRSLTSVSLPDMGELVDAGEVFGSCGSIETITIGALPKATTLIALAYGCTALKSLKIGAMPNVVNIKQLAYGCSSLAEVNLGVEEVNVSDVSSAFQGCTSLRSIRGVLNYVDIVNDGGALGGCTALEDVRINAAKCDLWLADCSALSTESLKYIVDNLQQATGNSITLHRAWSVAHPAEAREYAKIAAQKGFTLNFR